MEDNEDRLLEQQKADRWDQLVADMEVMEEFEDHVWIKVSKEILYDPIGE